MKQPINILVNTDTPQFTQFLAGVRKQYETHLRENFSRLPIETIEANFGTRYVKVCKVNERGGQSVYMFIDRTNGDVLKAAGFNAPAKHARGNIFAPDNGLGCVNPYGVTYLR